MVVFSPFELALAYIFAVQRDFGKGMVGCWLISASTILACPIEFHTRGPLDERHYIAFQYRDKLAVNCTRVRYTAVHKMYDAKRRMEEIAKRELVTAAVVTAYYASVLRSSASENMST